MHNKRSKPAGEPAGHKPSQFAPYAPGGSPRPSKLTNKNRSKPQKTESEVRVEHDQSGISEG
jgi:hypothetical protein